MTERHNGTVMQPGVQLTGLGHYFPGQPVTNAFFEQIPELGIDDAWIVEHTGVRTRHWPESDDERPVEMGVAAARKALDHAGITAGDVDLLIGTTSTTRARVNPSSATNRYPDISLPVQNLLGARNAACFDITATACAGFLYTSTVARTLLHLLGKRTALIVAAENPKPILNFKYRYSALFGAGAAAAVWSRVDRGPSGLVDTVVKSDGRHFDAFDIDDEDKILMRGGQIGELGPRLLIDAAQTLLRQNDLELGQIDWIIPHQGNLNMINEVSAALGIPRERLLLNIDRRGNTSSVSIPSCLSEHVHSGKIKPGNLIIALGIGRGLNWGAMLFRYR
ncbi:ketoacyl-ACP synthase III [Protofrankia symbiont of Coriaria ruscifolia]|uniref:ketoacyl-ACP synthase III n=1 Tax=Protofrankia symbiont of Coriaria ruscifolia TaxID=1306542 RepID=UPI001A943F80|nr:ketoacyl-ACP synthase III [Protofrankia symbiont of Coriaria ruscifolia]